jgi:hypothetical protein
MDFVNKPRTVSTGPSDREMIRHGRTFDVVANLVNCRTGVHGHYIFVGPIEPRCRLFDGKAVIEVVDEEHAKWCLGSSAGEWTPCLIVYGTRQQQTDSVQRHVAPLEFS